MHLEPCPWRWPWLAVRRKWPCCAWQRTVNGDLSRRVALAPPFMI